LTDLNSIWQVGTLGANDTLSNGGPWFPGEGEISGATPSQNVQLLPTYDKDDL